MEGTFCHAQDQRAVLETAAASLDLESGVRWLSLSLSSAVVVAFDVVTPGGHAVKALSLNLYTYPAHEYNRPVDSLSRSCSARLCRTI